MLKPTEFSFFDSPQGELAPSLFRSGRTKPSNATQEVTVIYGPGSIEGDCHIITWIRKLGDASKQRKKMLLNIGKKITTPVSHRMRKIQKCVYRKSVSRNLPSSERCDALHVSCHPMLIGRPEIFEKMAKGMYDKCHAK